VKPEKRKVTASEVGAYAFCPEHWRLDHALKLPSANRAQKVQGAREHKEWERLEKTTSSGVRLVLVVALIGLILMCLQLARW